MKKSVVLFLAISFIFWFSPSYSMNLYGGPSNNTSKKRSEASIKASDSYVIFRTGGVRHKQGKKTTTVLPSVVRSPLHRGDEVRTKSKSRADIYIRDLAVVRLKENSVVQVKRNQFQGKKWLANLKLVKGKILVILKKKLYGGSKFVVHTPTAVAGVRGTVFVVEATAKESQIKVLEGKVETGLLKGETGEGLPIEESFITLPAGKEMDLFVGQEVLKPEEIKPEEIKTEENWASEPDFQAIISGEAPYPEEGSTEEKGPSAPESPKEPGAEEKESMKQEAPTDHDKTKTELNENIKEEIAAPEGGKTNEGISREEFLPQEDMNLRDQIKSELDQPEIISPELGGGGGPLENSPNEIPQEVPPAGPQ